METLHRAFAPLLVLILIFPGYSAEAQASAKRKAAADLLIVGGTVVTMDPLRRVIEGGAVAVRNGEILAVGDARQVTSSFSAKRVIDASGKVVIPGLVNTHTHIPMTLFRGLADDLDLQEWLTRHIFPAEAKNVNEDMVRIGTRLGLAEMVRGGTTTFNDMYYFLDAMAEETSKAGVRAVLGQTLIDFPAPDYKSFDEGLAGAERFVNRWKGHRLIVPAVAPHAPYTVSESHLLKSRALADRLGAPIHIHLAEAATETEFVQQNHQGMRPIEYVEKIGFLNDRTIAAHVIQANEKELLTLKRIGVGIAHNPQSNMKLAAGVAPFPLMLKMDIRVGLGTDGPASNNDLSLWEEMDTAAKLHKVFSNDPKVASALEMFEAATIGGARALHMERLIGSIEEGKRADIVIVDFNGLNQTPRYNVYSHLVYATKSNDVNTVLIDGRIVMSQRRLLTLDEGVIKRDANAYHLKIIDSLKAR